jgi:hypothetical protein
VNCFVLVLGNLFYVFLLRSVFLLPGELCGLFPGSDPTSVQLHRVVELSSGIIDDQELLQQEGTSPVSKLKEALTSKQAFQKYYLVSRTG